MSRGTVDGPLRLGTRGSDLALTQSGSVAAALRRLGADVELVVIRTAGDRSSAPSFASIGPQGVFVREIEQALLAGNIDLAVHSYKDLPTRSPPDLLVAAVPERADPADVLLVRSDSLDDSRDPFIPLGTGARVGTASARRSAWLRHYRDDLEIASLRGNVPTRIGRLHERRYDAIVLAAAGLERLRPAADEPATMLDGITVRRLEPREFVPAPAQGALAVQCRAADAEIVALLEHIDDAASHATVRIERAALAEAEGGCEVAFGAHCVADAAGFTLTTMLERDGLIGAAAVSGDDVAALGAAGWAALARTFA
jgi:hydroxymethylbilane synthase